MAAKKVSNETYVVFNESDGTDSFFGFGDTLFEAVSSYCDNYRDGMGRMPDSGDGMVYMVSPRKQFSSLK